MKRKKLSNKAKGKILIFVGIGGVVLIPLAIIFSRFNFKAFGYILHAHFGAFIESGFHWAILGVFAYWALLLLMRAFIDHVFPMLCYFIGRPFKYLTVWRICRKKGYDCRFRRAPFVSLGGVEKCADIEIQMGAQALHIHFIDIPFPVLRMFLLVNDREYRMHRSIPGKLKVMGFGVRPGPRAMDEENYDTYTIPEFPPKGAESHYLVIDPTYADSFFLDSRAMLDITGECTVGNVTVCKWKILKKRIKNDLYATTQ